MCPPSKLISDSYQSLTQSNSYQTDVKPTAQFDRTLASNDISVRRSPWRVLLLLLLLRGDADADADADADEDSAFDTRLISQ